MAKGQFCLAKTRLHAARSPAILLEKHFLVGAAMLYKGGREITRAAPLRGGIREQNDDGTR